MITKNDKLKCDECGQFVPFNDLLEGNAIHHQLTPDSFCSLESDITLCKEHYSGV